MKKILLFLGLFLVPCIVFAVQGGPKNGTVKNVTLTSANTQYSVTIPNGTSGITLQSRSSQDFKIAFTPNTFDTTYFTVKSGSVFNEHNLGLDATNYSPYTTIYFASANAGQVVEVVYFQ